MNGDVKFEDALAARLDIIKPSRQDIQDCLAQHPPKFTPGMVVSIIVVSCGFISIYMLIILLALFRHQETHSSVAGKRHRCVPRVGWLSPHD